jgi:hypothetical protein
MMEHLLTEDSFSLYLENVGLRPKGSAWPPADAIRHCVLHSLISPSIHQAVTVANILKRNTILIMPTNSHVCRPELVYLPADIDKLITKSLLQSIDNYACIRNYLLLYEVQVLSTGGANKLISSSSDENTEVNDSVTDGIKTFTPRSTEAVWNESKKQNLTDKNCIKLHEKLQTSDITTETTAAYTKQIQSHTATADDKISDGNETPYKIEIPFPTTAAHHNIPVPPTAAHHHIPVLPTAAHHNIPVPPTAAHQNNIPVPPTAAHHHIPVLPTAAHNNIPVPPTAAQQNIPVPPTAAHQNIPVPPTAAHHNIPVKSMLTYPSIMYKQTNATAHQTETLTKITTTYHNIPNETTDTYHRQVQDASRAVFSNTTVKTTTPYPNDIPLLRTTAYDNSVPLTNTSTDHSRIPVEAATDFDSDYTGKTTGTYHNDTTHKSASTYDTDINGKATSGYHNEREDIGSESTKNVSADELDDQKSSTEFVTTRNLLQTSDELDDTRTSTEFVTARNILETVLYGTNDRETNPKFATAWNTLKTTTDIFSDKTRNKEYVTSSNVFQRNTEGINDNTRKTDSEVLPTITTYIYDNSGDTQLENRVTLPETLSGGLSICGEEEEGVACTGTKIQLEATTNSLEAVDTGEPQLERSKYFLKSTTESVSDLAQHASPDSSTETGDNQTFLTATAPPNEHRNTGTEGDHVKHFNASNEEVPEEEQPNSNVHKTSHKDPDVFEQTSEHNQEQQNSTSADIFEMMLQMVNSTISPSELLTLQILYELLLSKYDVPHVSIGTETPGGANTTHRVPQNGVPAEIRNTLKVLELVPGIMDDHILDTVTDEEINSLREAVENVWSMVENETEISTANSFVTNHQGEDHVVHSKTVSQMPEINANRPKRQITDGLLRNHNDVYESVGSPL